ncbi:MAG: energy-coupling factor ABC transporter substrate-binding protein [Methanoregula sp.]|jgi:cobalt/nickel transport protein|uniref:energy-coupling factor ABC transporter substrate-binding protein n=1 Tax=Methanoregula sp. TaxID=2052170 RepID=UPI003C7749B7
MIPRFFIKYKLEIIFAVFTVVFAAVFLIQNASIQATAKPGQETWQGSDDMGSAAIEATGYTPWIQPLWTPPSTEVESLLFSIQSGLGALVIGYFFGYYRGQRECSKSP